MARRLLAQNRADDVARMLEPLVEPIGSGTPDPEQAIVRALLARIALRHHADPQTALTLLEPVAPERAPGLPVGPAAEVDLWLAWSLFQGDNAHPYRRLMAIDRAAACFRDRARLADLAWALMARAEIYDALDEVGLARQARGEAGDLFQRLPEYTPAGSDPASPAPWPSATMRAAVERVGFLATTRLPLLLLGERGSGKRTLAKAFHRSSGAAGPFVIYRHDGTSPSYAVSLLEEKMAEAAGGTLFIDELTDVPRAAQDRLLAMHETTTAPTRLVVASTRPLEAAIAGQGVCGECLARLAAGVVHLPPLRMRKEDIPVLIGAILQELTPAGSAVACLTDAALDALVAYHWPGNVRQLRNELERMLTPLHSEPAAVIDLTDLAPEIRTTGRTPPPPAGPERRPSTLPDVVSDVLPDPSGSLDALLAQTERRVIESVLIRHQGHITAAAEALGLTRQGLHKKIKRLGIAVDSLGGGAPRDRSFATN